jgi:hypothetical protein
MVFIWNVKCPVSGQCKATLNLKIKTGVGRHCYTAGLGLCFLAEIAVLKGRLSLQARIVARHCSSVHAATDELPNQTFHGYFLHAAVDMLNNVCAFPFAAGPAVLVNKSFYAVQGVYLSCVINVWEDGPPCM